MKNKIKKLVLLERTTKDKQNGVENPTPEFVPAHIEQEQGDGENPTPEFVPAHIEQMNFEYFLRNMERSYPDCVKHIREIYADRFGLSERSVELATTDEKLSLVNEFLIKFGFPTLSYMDADIAYHEDGDEAFFQEKLEPVFTSLEPDLW